MAIQSQLGKANPVTVPDGPGRRLTGYGRKDGLRLEFDPDGIPVAVRHGPLLLNQLITDPLDAGLFRVLVRERGDGKVLSAAPAAGAGACFRAGARRPAWKVTPADGIECVAELRIHGELDAWAWAITVSNTSGRSREVDALIGQDIGLNDEVALRRNEAFNSHYLDFNPVEDAAIGWVLLVRQNQRTAAGCNPLLLMACLGRAASYCTDALQFFGAGHRLTGCAAAAGASCLPSRKLQYECAYGGLQSAPLRLAAGETGEIVFVCRFLAHHPAATSRDDLELLAGLGSLGGPCDEEPAAAPAATPASLFMDTPWLHGDEPAEADWSRWFPDAHRHEERDASGRLLSFFTGDETHVASRTKESRVLRPHGHVLRSGDYAYPDPGQFGISCYAAGIFAAQAYLGNPSMARLLSVVRNTLNVVRTSGQRVFVRLGGRWHQLGIPSAFAMSPGEASWIYNHGDVEIRLRAWCASQDSASFLKVTVERGGPLEFTFTHRLALGAEEGEGAATAGLRAVEGLLLAAPSPGSAAARNEPGANFAIAIDDPGTLAAAGGDELAASADDHSGTASYFILRTKPVHNCRIIMAAGRSGKDALLEQLVRLRSPGAQDPPASRPPVNPFRIRGGGDAGVGRLAEILPWFNHNAAIHFSAPHGLEQYEGGAWGVRDVCQGSLEWLLSSGHHAIARKVIMEVFSRQHAADGSWPQWFMHPPYDRIQQLHCHGDVCFWPVKAVCDYVEASNDFSILDEQLGYTDPRDFSACGPRESILEHCDRVVRQYEDRRLPGTAIVNYGDGDWDDTLQPADPELRTRMASAWTVGLVCHTFSQFAALCRRRGYSDRVGRLESHLRAMAADLRSRLMPDGIIAGFLIHDASGDRWLLHPRDKVTGIRYRLLPMTRAVLAGLFDRTEMERHFAIIRSELLFDDGVRLMSEPVRYHGGVETLFKRGETAANVGREIGLMYTHAHIRYAEALAVTGDADGLWRALQLVNPVGLSHVLAIAEIRQANVFYSSSDADFPDREQASLHWEELRAGKVAVRGGWRLYSSGPGLVLNLVRSSLLGIRSSFGDLVMDPVLPRSLDGLEVGTRVFNKVVKIHYTVRDGCCGPAGVELNAIAIEASREPNPYRKGGLRIPGSLIGSLDPSRENTIRILL